MINDLCKLRSYSDLNFRWDTSCIIYSFIVSCILLLLKLHILIFLYIYIPNFVMIKLFGLFPNMMYENFERIINLFVGAGFRTTFDVIHLQCINCSISKFFVNAIFILFYIFEHTKLIRTNYITIFNPKM